MSVCRSSAQQFLRQTRSHIPATTSCKRLRLTSLVRTIHSSPARSKNDSQKTPTSTPKDTFTDVIPQVSRKPTIRPRAEIAAEKKKLARAPEEGRIKEHFRPYTKEELDALKSYYSDEQIEALEAAESTVDVNDLAEQWGERLDQWKVDYLDDLSQVDPMIDQVAQLQLSDAPQFQFRTEDQFEEMVDSNPNFNGLSMTEMLFLIEKRNFLSDEVKAGLRTLHRWKGTHKEVAAKRILWRYIPIRYLQSQISDANGPGQLATIALDIDSGKYAVEFLFEMLDAIKMEDNIKKYELLALKHWCGTAKEESLRPKLMRIIEEHGGFEDKAVINQAHLNRLKNSHEKELGYDPSAAGNWLVEGRHQDLYNRDIFYNAVMPAIPKIKDPRVRYDHETSEDAVGAAYSRLARTLDVSVKYLKNIRVKALVMHRVVNQTRQGKIQSFYVLSVSGNENGLLGIGEGKSAEVEDARLQSRMAALRNLKPIVRYEKRTIYGKHEAKVGGTTVELAARPPGFGIRTQHLIFEIARCAGIRDLAARVGRSRNKMNTVKATVEALLAQKLPEDIAHARGKKLVDVRKVYYNKTVY